MKKTKLTVTALALAGLLMVSAAAAGVSQTVTRTKSDRDCPTPDAVTGATSKPDTDRSASQAGPAAAEPGSYESRIAALSAEADELVRQADKVSDLAGYRDFRAALHAFEDREEELEEELERAYKTGALTAERYRSLEQSLEQAEDKAEDLDDAVEHRLGLDD